MLLGADVTSNIEGKLVTKKKCMCIINTHCHRRIGPLFLGRLVI